MQFQGIRILEDFRANVAGVNVLAWGVKGGNSFNNELRLPVDSTLTFNVCRCKEGDLHGDKNFRGKPHL